MIANRMPTFAQAMHGGDCPVGEHLALGNEGTVNVSQHQANGRHGYG